MKTYKKTAEPDVASSDATNVRTSIVRDGGEYVVNGRKWFISNAACERTKIFIVMGKSDPANPNLHIQQSQILIPRDTPGVTITRPLTTLGYDDAPLGHAEMRFENVRVPAENILLGEGRGFEIAQGRLGPGRIHHCMRLIGAAQRMDEIGPKDSRDYIAAAKITVPLMAQTVIDRCMQIHGAGGLTGDYFMADAYNYARWCRLADGPDQVHMMALGKQIIKRYAG